MNYSVYYSIRFDVEAETKETAFLKAEELFRAWTQGTSDTIPDLVELDEVVLLNTHDANTCTVPECTWCYVS